MSEDKTKMVGMYVFVADWISGTRHLTLQQRGIYWDLLAFSQTFNGRGLPNDINELCRLILPFEPNIEKAEELRSDLINVINSKFQLVDNRFYNERQHKEFLKSKELSITRSRARKSKKFDTVLLEQNANNTYKYNYKDNNKYITNINIEEIFNDNVWSRLKYRKGSKQKAFEKYLKIKDNVDDDVLVQKYNNLCEQTSDPTFCPHFITWLNQSRWLDEEIFSPESFKQKHNINAFYQDTKNNVHHFTTKESWGIVDYYYDNLGKMVDKEDYFGEEKKESA